METFVKIIGWAIVLAVCFATLNAIGIVPALIIWTLCKIADKGAA